MVNSSGSFLTTLGRLLKASPTLSFRQLMKEEECVVCVCVFGFRFVSKQKLSWVTAERRLKTQPTNALQSKASKDK